MMISGLFRFLNGRVENFIGKAMAQALKRQKKQEKEEMKRMRKEEKAREKEARREAREQVRKAREERMAHKNNETTTAEESDDEMSDGENSYSGMTASNVTKSRPAFGGFDDVGTTETFTDMNDLD